MIYEQYEFEILYRMAKKIGIELFYSIPILLYTMLMLIVNYPPSKASGIAAC